MSSDVLTEVSNLASMDSPHSSSLGTEMVFTGVTFVLDITNRHVGVGGTEVDYGCICFFFREVASRNLYVREDR